MRLCIKGRHKLSHKFIIRCCLKNFLRILKLKIFNFIWYFFLFPKPKMTQEK